MKTQNKCLSYRELSRWLEEALFAVVAEKNQRRAETALFLEKLLGLSQETIMREPETIYSDLLKLENLKKQLEKRIDERLPIQYILGEANFYNLLFTVSPAVLIPRPETELLVESALLEIKNNNYKHIFDMATGSGCIGITLKKNAPQINVISSDISEAALTVAQQNAKHHNVDITFRCGSWFDALLSEERQAKFDLICCNPPYINTKSEHTITKEVLQEPRIALFSNCEPVLLYQELITNSLEYLKPGGQVLLEMEASTFSALEAFLIEHDFRFSTIKDYTGVTRHLQVFK